MKVGQQGPKVSRLR